MKFNVEQIKDKISKLPIESLAVKSGFQKRTPRKINAVSFVIGFFMMVHLKGNTLSDWAQNISHQIGELVSKQAIEKKLQFRQEAFAYQLLSAALKQSLEIAQAIRQPQLFASFCKVYLEDSSCFKLPAGLAAFFPGPYSHAGDCATAKIQLRMNLLDETYEDIQLQSYRDNDQKQAGDILSVLQRGSLIIRDLGYWSLKVFRRIAERQAFFVSRYRYDVQCLCPDTQEVIDLPKQLKRLERKNIQVLDCDILLGKKEKLPVRLVAIKAPQQVAQARRRKAAKDRNKKANHSKKYLTLLGWTIFITNVPKEVWGYKDILKAYGFRWRIEIVFKCWKSKFNMQQLFSNKQSLSPARVVITCILFLVFATVFFARWAAYFIHAVYQATQKWVSLIKFAGYVKDHFFELLLAEDLMEFVPQVAYYCTYEKRKGRYNTLELLYDKNLS